MKIDNLLYLVGGELKNSPTISSFHHIQLSPYKVKRGDLFIAQNKTDIQEAINNGAYAILFEGWAQIIDQEIAWIQVPSLSQAALKLLRFLLINDRTPLHLFDALSYDLAQEFINDSSLLFSRADPLQDLYNYVHKEPMAVVVKEKNYLQRLALDAEPIENGTFQVISHRLFESSFIYEGRYHERVLVAPLLLPSLRNVLDLARTYSLSISLSHPPKNHFSPRYVLEDFRQVDFGSSDRVLIFESDYTFAQEAKAYLQERAPWAKTLFISDRELEGFHTVGCVEELKEILYNRAFNYALLAMKPLDMEVLVKRRAQRSLF